MLNSKMAGILAMTAISAQAFNSPPAWLTKPMRRRERPVVERMVTSDSAEIKAHNAAVDAKKAAKKAMKEVKP